MTGSGKNLNLIGSTAKWGDQKSLLPPGAYARFQSADKESFYEIQIFSNVKTSTCLWRRLLFLKSI